MELFNKATRIIIFIFLSNVIFNLAKAEIPLFSQQELDLLKKHLFANISTENRNFSKIIGGKIIFSKPGAVIASPSIKGKAFQMDYEVHWVRDAALSMAEVVYLYKHSPLQEKHKLKKYLLNYIQFEQSIHDFWAKKQKKLLAEPKYNFDATVWQGEWARPQTDGPALRAITMMSIAFEFLKEGNKKFVQANILPLITADLEYISQHWQEPTYDLWEELIAKDQFFTKMVQRKAFSDAKRFFLLMDNQDKSKFYSKLKNKITNSLRKHWNAKRGYLSETLAKQDIKGGGLNSAILLALLYGNLNDNNDFFSLDNDAVLSTVFYMQNSFAKIYPVNLKYKNNDTLIGRYINDVYDGNHFEYGNPWVLTTAALAEYYFSLARIYLIKQKIEITPTNKMFFKQLSNDIEHPITISVKTHPKQFYRLIKQLIKVGDSLIKHIKQYAICYAPNDCLHFAEQIDRATGEQISAKDLTWGYASLLSAMHAKDAAFTQ